MTAGPGWRSPGDCYSGGLGLIGLIALIGFIGLIGSACLIGLIGIIGLIAGVLRRFPWACPSVHPVLRHPCARPEMRTLAGRMGGLSSTVTCLAGIADLPARDVALAERGLLIDLLGAGAIRSSARCAGRRNSALSTSLNWPIPASFREICRLHRDGATGDIQDDASDPGRAAGSEIEGRPGHILRRAKAP